MREESTNHSDKSDFGDALIMVVDDSNSDVRLLERAIRQAGVIDPLLILNGGAAAIRYLGREGEFADATRHPLPRIIFLDLKMPPPDGLAVLRWKQAQKQLPKMLWVVLSRLDNVKIINEAYHCGANTYLSKPLRSADVQNLIQAYREYWMLQGPR